MSSGRRFESLTDEDLENLIESKDSNMSAKPLVMNFHNCNINLYMNNPTGSTVL